MSLCSLSVSRLCPLLRLETERRGMCSALTYLLSLLTEPMLNHLKSCYQTQSRDSQQTPTQKCSSRKFTGAIYSTLYPCALHFRPFVAHSGPCFQSLFSFSTAIFSFTQSFPSSKLPTVNNKIFSRTNVKKQRLKNRFFVSGFVFCLHFFHPSV